ncbi:NAD(P)-binding domain-containing protein [Falsiroseomonas tokyonensis]|uniref:NAD(P)-binding domain-containing protein n=1 Tax=Falsiroseomonas tokyonensis TaxID=430521 RepID=A0ABV7BRN6_9PROT|nr:NAD(P)/FAD-dependent oxidoreductase [Falsiroseomonas tokyonensis]MBU8536787.1 NAD(P)/FAD-dependent oxidoreductase [Falsiroseomonas tokyonensis]
MDALPPPDALTRLERRLEWELETLAYPARPWVRPVTHPDGPVLDVLVVGGGQCGLATAFALKRARIENIAVLEAEPTGQAGVWTRFARMHTLRTPKHVTGPELGLPSLSIRAWYEAQYGEAAWAALHKIGREDWQAYLTWLQRVLALPVRHGWRVTGITPEGDALLAVQAVHADGTAQRLLARQVVLATGLDGCGGWQVPAMIAQALPATHYAHTAQPIDFARLAGRRVAILGAGASAFDNAATALEAGAVRVDLLARRPVLPSVNPNRWMEFFGFLHHFADLPDAQKWRFMQTLFALNQPPPQETFSRCAAHDRFFLHLGAPLTTLGMMGETIRLETPRATLEVDFLIVGTGLVVDLTLRPELAGLAQHIALWRDRFAPAAEDRLLGAYPYLNDSFAFTERHPGAAPWLARLRSSSFAAMPSTASSAGISTLRPTVERIARGIARDLFCEQSGADYDSLCAYDEAELVDLRLASDRSPA